MLVFPSPCQKHEDFFSLIFFSLIFTGRAPGDKPHKYMAPLPRLGTLGFFTLRPVHTEPPAICRSHFRFSCSGNFCSWVFAPISCDSLYLPGRLSNLRGAGGGGAAIFPGTPLHLRRVVNFSVCSTFTC